MPKMKTHKGVAKRFKTTGTGKLKYKKAGKSHLLTTKNKARKRKLRKPGVVSPVDQTAVKRLLPYGGV